jgi:tetratricopeptide (TPR) repeat protein
MSKKILISFVALLVIFSGVAVWYATSSESFHATIATRLSDADRKAFEEKRDQAKEKVKEDPTQSGWFITLGNIEETLGELGAAKDAYLKASLLEPKNFIPVYDLAQVLKSGGAYKESEKTFRQALSIDDTQEVVWLGLFDLTQYNLKHSELEMNKFFEEALGKTNRSAQILGRIGRYFEEIGKPDWGAPYKKEAAEKTSQGSSDANLKPQEIKLEVQ